MKKERMKILELLEQGKITADEAANLLSAIKKPDEGGSVHFFDEETREELEEKFQRFTKNVDSFAREFGGKVQSVYKEVEPKIKKASQAVLEKTAAVFDEISKSLNESLENARKAAEASKEDCCGENDGCCGEESDEGPREN